MNILIAEDDPSIHTGLVKFFTHIGFVPHVAIDGEQAVQLLSKHGFKCVVLDLGLPKLSGKNVLRYLRKNHPEVPTVIVSAATHVEDRIESLNLGADDYLPKPFSLLELQARICAVLRRHSPNLSSVVELGPLALDRTCYTAKLEGHSLNLSKREFELLEILVTRHGKQVRKEFISESLSDIDTFVSRNLIEVYVHKLRKKLEPAGLYIKTSRGLGYVLSMEKTQPAIQDHPQVPEIAV